MRWRILGTDVGLEMRESRRGGKLVPNRTLLTLSALAQDHAINNDLFITGRVDLLVDLVAYQSDLSLY